MRVEKFESVEDLENSILFSEWVLSQKHTIFWKQWQIENPDKLKMLEEAKKNIQQLAFNKKIAAPDEINQELENIWTQINKEQPSSITTKHAKTTTLKLNNILRVAAAALFLSIGSWVTYQYFSSPFQLYTTEYGQTQNIDLPDATKLILQANSRLKVPKNWDNKKSREVWLEGEAFFDVTKKAGNSPIKFIVHTPDFNVEVLGTEFDVLYREKNKRVVLQEGKIRMNWDQQKSMELLPNEMVEFSTAENKYQKTVVNPSIYTSWTNEKIILDHTPFSEIARMLSENYGYEMNIHSSVDLDKTRSSIGAIQIKSIDDLLPVIEASYEVKITKKDNRIEVE